MDAGMDPETVVKIEGYSIESFEENDEGFDSYTNGLHSSQNSASVSDRSVVNFEQNQEIGPDSDSALEPIATPPREGLELLQLAKAKEIKKDSTATAQDQERHKCSIPNCTKSFSTKRKLRVHFNYDHGQNWFKCLLCEKAYPTRGGVIRHFSIHSSDRPHLCNLCPKSFKLSHSLVSHTERVHRSSSKTKSTTTAAVPRSQPDSEKQQSLSDNAAVENQCQGTGPLYSLSKTDTEVVEQCHKCPFPNCSKTFSTSKKLTAHRIDDHGETSFKCDLCEKSFLSKAVLQTHFITHSRARPHRCHLCPKSFKYKNNLWSHELIVHLVTRENKRGRPTPTTHSAKQSQLGSAVAVADAVDMETLIIPELINPWLPVVQHDVEEGVKKVRRRKQVHAKTHRNISNIL